MSKANLIGLENEIKGRPDVRSAILALLEGIAERIQDAKTHGSELHDLAEALQAKAQEFAAAIQAKCGTSAETLPAEPEAPPTATPV